MNCIVLGRNGPYPTVGGACSGYLLEQEGTYLLFDLGSGAFSRLIGVIDPKNLDAIYISHWHHDHCSDLLVLAYYLQSFEKEKGKAINIYGPKDKNSPVLQWIKKSPYFSFHVVAPGEKQQIKNMEVFIGPARHGGSCVSYKTQGWGYTGDTNTLPALETFFKGVKWLFACGCNLKKDWTEESPHLSGIKAGELAEKIGAEKLYITHIKPRVDISTLEAEGQSAFKETEIVQEGIYVF